MTATQVKDSATKARERERAEQAGIVTGLRQILLADEQLLAFTRGRIAGGWRGKLNVGPEAFFAPAVNVALTDRRILLQHIHVENGRPSEIAPHAFPVEDLHDLTFADIETFGGDPAARLTIKLTQEQQFRIRVAGRLNFEGAQNMAQLFAAMAPARNRPNPSPTTGACPACAHPLDAPAKFCPFCGSRIQQETQTVDVRPQQPPTADAEDVDATPSPAVVDGELNLTGSVENLESDRYEAPTSAPLSELLGVGSDSEPVTETSEAAPQNAAASIETPPPGWHTALHEPEPESANATGVTAQAPEGWTNLEVEAPAVSNSEPCAGNEAQTPPWDSARESHEENNA